MFLLLGVACFIVILIVGRGVFIIIIIVGRGVFIIIWLSAYWAFYLFIFIYSSIFVRRGVKG